MGGHRGPYDEMNTTGRIDIHSHLLPGVDDGCANVAESIECAKRLVEAGYTHSYCTPHVWTSHPDNNVDVIPRRVEALQAAVDKAGVSLKLMPGGENNFTELRDLSDEPLVTYGLADKYVLADIWVDALPTYFYDGVRAMRDRGLTVILAHPERMRAVQLEPALGDKLSKLGLLLQGNLQCFGDPPGTPTRKTADLFLKECRYTFLATDLHNAGTLGMRLNGLRNAIELVGNDVVDRLTVHNPCRLMDGKPLE
jgi:protein-tyrosine phosphatase